jgi:hypothetical protein
VIDKDPAAYSIVTYAWVLFLSIWGGAVSFIRRVKAGDSRPHNLVEFIGEIVTSAFAGVITFYLCEAAGISGLVTAVLVATTGHMGTRAIYQIERLVEKRLGTL